MKDKAVTIIDTLLTRLRQGLPEKCRNVTGNVLAWETSNELFFNESKLHTMIKNPQFDSPQPLEWSYYFVASVQKQECRLSVFVDLFFRITLLERSKKNWLKNIHWIDELTSCMSNYTLLQDKLKMYYALWMQFQLIKYIPSYDFTGKRTFYLTKAVNLDRYLRVKNLSEYPLYW
jgi:hypothetical protein